MWKVINAVGVVFRVCALLSLGGLLWLALEVVAPTGDPFVVGPLGIALITVLLLVRPVRRELSGWIAGTVTHKSADS
jgi:hypothetical protein